jgi:hypothetical protein
MQARSSYPSRPSPKSSIQLPFHKNHDVHTSKLAMPDLTIRPRVNFTPHHPFDRRIFVFLRPVASRCDYEGVGVCERNLALQLAKAHAYKREQHEIP